MTNGEHKKQDCDCDDCKQTKAAIEELIQEMMKLPNLHENTIRELFMKRLAPNIALLLASQRALVNIFGEVVPFMEIMKMTAISRLMDRLMEKSDAKNDTSGLVANEGTTL